jgi:hypothetical protein
MFDFCSAVTSFECDSEAAECISSCKLATPNITQWKNSQLCGIYDTTHSTYLEVTKWFQNQFHCEQ